MAKNIVGYLRNNQSLPPMNGDHPFCEFDAAVFSLMAYYPLTFVSKSDDSDDSGFPTFRDYCERTLGACGGTSTSTSTQSNQEFTRIWDGYTLNKYTRPEFKPELDLLEHVKENPRYSGVRLEMSHVINSEWDREHGPETCAQFGAVTFVLPYKSEGKEIRVITFRGTNGTLVGWKDDLYFALDNNTIVKDKAVEYISNVIKKFSDSKFVITGHSKGGHLAVYGFYSFISNKLHEGFSFDSLKEMFYSERCGKAVFNFDGPGIKQGEKNTFESEIGARNFVTSERMVVVYAPSSAVVSLLLGVSCQNEARCYVSSDASGFFQHSLRSWSIDSSFAFSRETNSRPFLPEDQDDFSKAISKSVNDFLESNGNTDNQDKLRQSIDAIFLILENGSGRHQELPGKDDLVNCAKKACYQVLNNQPLAEVLREFLDDLIRNLEDSPMTEEMKYIAAIAILVRCLIQSRECLIELRSYFEDPSWTEEEKISMASEVIKGIIPSNFSQTGWYLDVYWGLQSMLG